MLQVEGFNVRVTDAGQYIVPSVDGQARLVTVEEYRARLARRLVEEVPSVEQFRARWIVPSERQEMLGRLPDAGRSALQVRALAELGYGLALRTRPEPAEALGYKHTDWLSTLPPATAATPQALTAQFAPAGTYGLESPEVFGLPEVMRAGGLIYSRVASGWRTSIAQPTSKRSPSQPAHAVRASRRKPSSS